MPLAPLRFNGFLFGLLATTLMTPEIRWLVSVLRDAAYAPPTAHPGSNAFVERISTAARENGVLVPVFHKVRASPVWTDLPQTLRDRLNLSAKVALSWEIATRGDFASGLEALAAQGVQGLLLKGTALAHLIYPAPHYRARGDTDLLLQDRSSAEKAWEVLRGLGYKRAVVVEGDYISHQYSCSKPGPFQRAITFDIHWKISNSNFFAQKLAFQYLWAERTSVAPLGAHAFTLGLPHTMLLALYHRAGHLGRGDPERLIWLYDIHLLGDRFDEDLWQRFTDLVTRHQLGPICLDGMRVTDDTFGLSIPEVVVSALEEPASGSAAQLAFKRPGVDRALFDIRTLPTWRERFLLIAEHLFPSRGYMAERFGADVPWKLPLAYLRRASGGLGKLRRKSKG